MNDRRSPAINSRLPLVVHAGCRFIFLPPLFVRKRIHITLLFLIAFAMGLQSAFAKTSSGFVFHVQNSTPSSSNSSANSGSALSGGIENNNGQLRLNLTNNSSRGFHGSGIVGIGNDSEQREIGQLAFSLSPQETKLFRLSGVSASGNQFSLKIFGQSGALVFYKIAPIKNVSDSASATTVTLHPVSDPKKKNTKVSLTEKGQPSLINVSPVTNVTGAPFTIAEITIKGRLLAGRSETNPFTVAFEMAAPRPIHEATMTIKLGKFKDLKPVSIKRNLTVEFKLPDQFDNERISYELTAKNGRVIAKGELEIGQLMADDVVTVTDIRTDRTSYEPGERVQATVLLEGKSPNGFHLEVRTRDGQGNVIFQDQYQSAGDNQINAHRFTVTLPRELATPVIFEFKIYNSGTGLLFDSGEREIPVKDAKRRP